MNVWKYCRIPVQRRSALFRAEVRGEGTNSARLIIPGYVKSENIAKCKVVLHFVYVMDGFPHYAHARVKARLFYSAVSCCFTAIFMFQIL